MKNPVALLSKKKASAEASIGIAIKVAADKTVNKAKMIFCAITLPVMALLRFRRVEHPMPSFGASSAEVVGYRLRDCSELGLCMGYPEGDVSAGFCSD